MSNVDFTLARLFCVLFIVVDHFKRTGHYYRDIVEWHLRVISWHAWLWITVVYYLRVRFISDTWVVCFLLKSWFKSFSCQFSFKTCVYIWHALARLHQMCKMKRIGSKSCVFVQRSARLLPLVVKTSSLVFAIVPVLYVRFCVSSCFTSDIVSRLLSGLLL